MNLIQYTFELFSKLYAGKDLRDQGCDQVMENPKSRPEIMMEAFSAFVYARSPQEEFTIDQIKGWCMISYPELADAPQQAWGAMTRIAMNRGIIDHTGRWTKSPAPSRHGGITGVYVRGPRI